MLVTRIRDWADQHSRKGRYTPVAIVFHWAMAALVLFQLGLGWYTTRMPAGGDRLQAYGLHSDIGLLILILAIGRFGWRLMVPGPINAADMPGWQSKVAGATHIVFYICFFGLPLSGWMMWSALGNAEPLEVAGLVPWPAFPFGNLDTAWQWAILDWAEDLHQIFVLTLLLLIPLHIAAALKHYLWDRDEVLGAMVPNVPDVEHSPADAPHMPQLQQFRNR